MLKVVSDDYCYHFGHRSIIHMLTHTKIDTHTHTLVHLYLDTCTHLQSTCHRISSSSPDSGDCCTSLQFPSSTTGWSSYGKSLGRPRKHGIPIKTQYDSFVSNKYNAQQRVTYQALNSCKTCAVQTEIMLHCLKGGYGIFMAY